MRRRFRAVVLTCLVAAAAAGCGSSATGITAAIQPDPVSAISAGVAGQAVYAASWEVVVSDLTGQGGTVESIDARVGGGAVTLDGPSSQSFGPNSSQATLGAFDRRTFHQSGSFTVDAAAGSTLSVTAHFRAQDGTTFQATAQARVTVR